MTIFGYKPNGTAWVGILIVSFFVFLAIFARLGSRPIARLKPS